MPDLYPPNYLGTAQKKPVIDIGVDFRFEAAHWLPNVPDDHKCSRMHGHSYRVTVTVTGPINPDTGMLLDYADIKTTVDPVIALLDHHTINDIIPNSTAENMTVWLWNQLSAYGLPALSAVTVHETAATHCTYRGQP